MKIKNCTVENMIDKHDAMIRAAERERCASEAIRIFASTSHHHQFVNGWNGACRDIAERIKELE